jgi:hypothetical protein
MLPFGKQQDILTFLSTTNPEEIWGGTTEKTQPKGTEDDSHAAVLERSAGA